MKLWLKWFRNVVQLREACSRSSTFTWMTLVLVSLSVRFDKLGVTSFVRALAFKEKSYPRFLHLFHSNALCLERLTQLWILLVLKIFRPLAVGDYAVCVADGLKVAKEGRRMPAVKKLHQESQNNSKSPFIMAVDLGRWVRVGVWREGSGVLFRNARFVEDWMRTQGKRPKFSRRDLPRTVRTLLAGPPGFGTFS